MKFKIKEERIGNTVSFESALSMIFEEYGLKPTLVEDKLKGIWRDVVGDIISAHSIPFKIFKKTLLVFADHSVYSNEISMMKDMAVKKINTLLGFEAVREIKVKIRRLDWKEISEINRDKENKI